MFQVIDQKKTCSSIYKDGEIFSSATYLELDKTWAYSPLLKNKDIEYAQIYAGGKSLDECCPEELKIRWISINKKLSSFINSFLQSKVSLKDNCFYDLVPQRFIKEYFELKNRICEHVFKTHKKPAEYTFYREFSEFLYDIGNRNIQLNKDRLMQRLYHPQGKKLWEKVNNGATTLQYNMHNSVTGRLTLTDKSFPLLTLPAGFRDVVQPTNDWFVAFDLNAAEMRIALALSNQQQPLNDLHDEVRKVVFNEEISRAQSKSISTQWLYGAKNADTLKYDLKLSDFYNKQFLFDNFWKDGRVITPFAREIEADAHHVISYLCQSTLIDLWHRQLLKMFKILENKESFVALLLHDQVVLDLKERERYLLPEIIRELSQTQFGTFPVKVEIGPNFGNLKKVNIKA
jgi:hypothetical protein